MPDSRSHPAVGGPTVGPTGGRADLVILGATVAGLGAALAAVRRGRTAIVLEPSDHVGGLTTGGLGDTDVGQAASIGGLARRFYEDVGRAYGKHGPVWHFEARVASAVLARWLAVPGLHVVTGALLDRRPSTAERTGPTLHAIRTTDGRRWEGRVFVDASYEGDLLELAGASFVVGREGRDEFGETLAGVRDDTELPAGISPWRIEGDPRSGLLDGVHADAGGPPGAGDAQVQAYNYRMNLTDDPDNRVPVERPDGYDEADYEILFRAIRAGQRGRFFKTNALPGRKADANNDSGISTDWNGRNHAYPRADEATRATLRAGHRRWQQGLVWTLQNHPRVPEDIRRRLAPWGLPRDEFPNHGHWPPALYVREARRLRGIEVVTEHHVRRTRPTPDGVALGSYAMDSHHVRYAVGADGFVRTEGGFYEKLASPYPISWRALLPRPAEVDNLVVPVAVSATHAAFGSIRMEPVFLMLGEAAGIGADLALAGSGRLADVSPDRLRAELRAAGAVVDVPEGEAGR